MWGVPYMHSYTCRDGSLPSEARQQAVFFILNKDERRILLDQETRFCGSSV